MNTTAKTLSALLLGAALVTPAFAQDAAANNGDSATAQNAPAAAPTTPVDTSANASSTGANTQMAMNTTGNAADLSSVPDTQKKYSRSSRNKDFKTEAETTKQLNEKATQLAQ